MFVVCLWSLQSQQVAANEELGAIRDELAEFEAAVAKAQQALELESEKVSKLQAAVQGAKANEKEVKTEASGVLKEGKAAKGQLEKAEAAVERAVSVGGGAGRGWAGSCRGVGRGGQGGGQG